MSGSLALAIAVWRAYGGGMASYGFWELTRRQAMGSKASDPYFVGVDLGQSRDPTAIAVVRRIEPLCPVPEEDFGLKPKPNKPDPAGGVFQVRETSRRRGPGASSRAATRCGTTDRW